MSLTEQQRSSAESKVKALLTAALADSACPLGVLTTKVQCDADAYDHVIGWRADPWTPVQQGDDGSWVHAVRTLRTERQRLIDRRAELTVDESEVMGLLSDGNGAATQVSSMVAAVVAQLVTEAVHELLERTDEVVELPADPTSFFDAQSGPGALRLLRFGQMPTLPESAPPVSDVRAYVGPRVFDAALIGWQGPAALSWFVAREPAV